MNISTFPGPCPRWETRRTILRQYAPADERAFLDLWCDPVVQRFSFVEYLDPPRTERFLRETIESMDQGSTFFVVVEDKERREVLGHVNLSFKPPPPNCESDGGCGGRDDRDLPDASIGIALKARYRGRGFGTEVMHWLITYGFRELGLRRISLTVVEDNIPALRMYKKIGFVEEERRREVSPSKGHPRDFVCMGIIREEWDLQKGRRRTFP